MCQRTILSKLVQNGSNVLLVGETGVGKSVVVHTLMEKLEMISAAYDASIAASGPNGSAGHADQDAVRTGSSEGWVAVTVGCSAQTSAADVRTDLRASLIAGAVIFSHQRMVSVLCFLSMTSTCLCWRNTARSHHPSCFARPSIKVDFMTPVKSDSL